MFAAFAVIFTMKLSAANGKNSRTIGNVLSVEQARMRLNLRRTKQHPKRFLRNPMWRKNCPPMEMSVICSNLARGCEKQYLPKQAEDFRKLAEFFRSKAVPVEEASTARLLELIEQDLAVGYPYGNAVAGEKPDRGGLRCQVWSEKVTRMLQSLLTRYQAEGEKMLQNTGVWVCSVCGFVYVGDCAPELCPVCKVSSWKFEKVERRV